MAAEYSRFALELEEAGEGDDDNDDGGGGRRRESRKGQCLLSTYYMILTCIALFDSHIGPWSQILV